MSHLKLTNVVKCFGGFRAVAGVDLAVKSGELISLLGASGCGKTTTLRIIAGLTKPTEGEIRLDGKNITDVPARRRNIGFVFQSYALFPAMTVFENICFGLKVRRNSSAQIGRKVGELLEMGHLMGLGRRYPAQLSGGQQQRVALLRALAIEPSLLLLDEPLSNLDAKLRIEIRKEIKKMQSLLGITTVYVTHDQDEALAISDRIAVMDRGTIQQVGPPVDIYTKPANRFVSDFIGRSNFLTCAVEGRDRLRIADTSVAYPIPDDLAAKKTAQLSFRPHDVTVRGASYVPPKDFSGLTLRARLSFETFMGTAFQIEAATPAGDAILAEIGVDERNRLNLRPGKEILLTIPSDRILLFT